MRSDPLPRWLIAALALPMVALLVGGGWFYRTQEQALRQKAERKLQAIAALKVDQIAAWRAERLADAAVIMETPFLAAAIARFLTDPNDGITGEIRTRFRSLATHYDYADVLLVGPEGRVRFSLTGVTGMGHEEIRPSLAASLRDGKPVIDELHTCSIDPDPHISVLAPILGRDGQDQRPIAAVVLVSGASRFLYRVIQSWPVPSDTAETVLVRRDGDDVLFLNGLRHQANTALRLRFPLSRTDLRAVMAVQGKERVVQGVDYRGVEVLAALKAVPDSPWLMVAKVDEAEAMAAWRSRSVLILAVLLGLVAAAVTGVGVVWQRNQKAHYQALFQTEAARRASEARHRTTLLSVGDGVIVADAKGSVELLNPVAEQLTGWSQAEAAGKPLDEVFHIVNEETRSEVDNPVVRVLREGVVVGLANHTLLIARDGREVPIADSGAPIMDDRGEITGVVLVFRDQTEERAAQKALRASEGRFRSIFSQTFQLAKIVSLDGTLTSASQTALAFIGADLADVIGQPLWDTPWWAHSQELRDWVRDAISRAAQGEVARREVTHVSKEGDLHCFDFSLKPVVDENGQPQYLLAESRDITERRRAEGELTLLKQQMEFILGATKTGIDIIDSEFGIRYIDPEWQKVYGDPTGRKCYEYFMGRDDVCPGCGIVRALETKKIVVTEEILPKENDRPVQVTTMPFQNEEGEWLVAEVNTDITDRKIAEAALRESEARYRTLVEQMPAVVYTTALDEASTTLYVSPQIEQFIGFSPEQYRADPDIWRQQLHPDDRDRVLEQVHRCHESGEPFVSEYRMLSRDGRVVWLRDQADLVRDEGGKPRFLQGIMLDITERKQAEEALRQSEEKHRLLFESSSDAIMILAPPSWRFTSGNPAAVEMFGGQDEADFVLRTFWEYSPPSQPDGLPSEGKAREMIETAMREGSYLFEWQHTRLDGEEFPARVLLTRFELAGQALLQGTVRDVSPEKQLEEQLRQSQKLEAVGQLAGGVAHDFNNLLTGMRGYVQFALDDVEPGTQTHEDLTETIGLTDRAAALTRQLLAFSRRQTLDMVVLDVNELLTDQLKMLGRLLGEDIGIQFVSAADLDNVRADPGQIEQVIMNLTLNARDAMPDGGKLTIETANVTLSQEYADQHVGVTPGPYVMIGVSDTGCGMDEETQSRIFEPFFTTKEPGRGTGLGLATVYGIAKQHGGNIWAYSEPGEGTTFKVYLPAVAEETTDRERPRPRVVGGSETVLLVEDEAAVRAVTQRLLEKLGYRVLVASDPGEAEDLAAGESRIDLLLTDVVLPDRNGRALYESLAVSRPDMKVLYMSGYTNNAIAHRGVLDEGTPFLPKPFDSETLAATVREVLDG